MRERFSEINIVGNSTPIPIGAEAKNITLKDGSILEQALGDINFQEKGSIIDQLGQLSTTIQNSYDYAPYTNPRFKNSLAVRQYNRDNITTEMTPNINAETESLVQNGLTATLNDDYIWTLAGIVDTQNEVRLILYGDPTGSERLTINEVGGTLPVGEGDYLISIKNNINVLQGALDAPVVTLRFEWGTDNSKLWTQVYEGEETKSFTIPSNNYLYRIYLCIRSNNSGLTFNENQENLLSFELKNTGVKQNKYDVVFDVQQDKRNKIWTTTVADNLEVRPKNQAEARSTLGTIYDTKWEGSLNLTGSLNVNRGVGSTIFLQDNGLSFKMDDINTYTGTSTAEKVASQNSFLSKTIETPYFITPKYTLEDDVVKGNLLYSAKDKHVFNISGTQPVEIGQDVTHISNVLKLDQRVISPFLSTYKYIDNFKDLENIMFDDTYPDHIPILFFARGKVATYLAWKTITGYLPDVIGFCYKFELDQEGAVGGGSGGNIKGKPVKGLIGYGIQTREYPSFYNSLDTMYKFRYTVGKEHHADSDRTRNFSCKKLFEVTSSGRWVTRDGNLVDNFYSNYIFEDRTWS